MHLDFLSCCDLEETRLNGRFLLPRRSALCEGVSLVPCRTVIESAVAELTGADNTFYIGQRRCTPRSCPTTAMVPRP